MFGTRAHDQGNQGNDWMKAVFDPATKPKPPLVAEKPRSVVFKDNQQVTSEQPPAISNIQVSNEQLEKIKMRQAYAVGGEGSDLYDLPLANEFVKDNPELALTLTAAALGVSTGGAGIMAARLLPTASRVGASLFGGVSQLPSIGSKFLMNNAASITRPIAGMSGTASASIAQSSIYWLPPTVLGVGAALNDPETIQHLQNILADNDYGPSNSASGAKVNNSGDKPPQQVSIWNINSTKQPNITATNYRVGNLQDIISRYMDTEEGKVSILSTPPCNQDVRSTITSTPTQDLSKFSRLPGFIPETYTPPMLESFPDHSDIASSMNILYKKIENLDYGKFSGKHFDNDLKYLHEQKYAGTKIADIDQNVRARMHDLIIPDASGRIKGIHNSQDHHIIHQNIEDAIWLFNEVGVDIHGQDNRITLPADRKLMEYGLTKMSQHIGRHSDKTVGDIQVKVGKIAKNLQNNIISKEQAKTELLEVISKEKQLLEIGKRSLNNVGKN